MLSLIKKHFNKHKLMNKLIGKKLSVNVRVIITDGSHPIGNGIGPLLEAEDVMAVLRNDPLAPLDLKEKSLMMAGILLEMAKCCTVGEGRRLAEEMLESGKALKKMNDIILAQGKQEMPIPGKYRCAVKSSKSGQVTEIDNEIIAKAARIAGAPDDQGAGLYLSKKINSRVQKGQLLYTIYAESQFKLGRAKEFVTDNNGYVMK